MAAKVCAGFKNASTHSLMTNDEMWVKGSYDFAKDGGAITDTYDLVSLPVGMVITDAYLQVTTAFVGATGTYEVGPVGATAGVIAQTAVALMTKDKVLPLVGPQLVGSANTLRLTIGTAAATAGAFDLFVKVKAN
jgi:hypothetical protein